MTNARVGFAFFRSRGVGVGVGANTRTYIVFMCVEQSLNGKYIHFNIVQSAKRIPNTKKQPTSDQEEERTNHCPLSSTIARIKNVDAIGPHTCSNLACCLHDAVDGRAGRLKGEAMRILQLVRTCEVFDVTPAASAKTGAGGRGALAEGIEHRL